MRLVTRVCAGYLSSISCERAEEMLSQLSESELDELASLDYDSGLVPDQACVVRDWFEDRGLPRELWGRIKTELIHVDDRASDSEGNEVQREIVSDWLEEHGAPRDYWDSLRTKEIKDASSI